MPCCAAKALWVQRESTDTPRTSTPSPPFDGSISAHCFVSTEQTGEKSSG